MQDFFGSIWWLIVSLGVLVTFHEFGHFWVARRFGVRVLRFSVGFGKPLWSRTGKDGTEYVIAAIPLGGYVKMLDEREYDVPPHALDSAFNRKPVWQRFAIVAAGPAFNLLLCIVLLWGMFVIGKDDYLPIVGRSTGIAANAGIAEGDLLLRIGDREVSTWTDANMLLLAAGLDRAPLSVEVQRGTDSPRTETLDFSQLPANADETTLFRDIGLVPQQLLLPARVGKVADASAAAKAGVLVDDLILAINERDIRFWDEVPSVLQDEATHQQPVTLRLRRAGETRMIQLQPDFDSEKQRWMLGIEPTRSSAPHDAKLRYGPLAAIPASLAETWRLTESSLGMLYRMVTGVASTKNLSGPISIAQYANASAQMGAAWFLFFLAVLSLSLCIMNLLPIPILDGGHLLYYLIEMIKGSPVSERTMMVGQYVGMAFLAGLMGIAFYNDILRQFAS
jgi:regulator of sigma E protease